MVKQRAMRNGTGPRKGSAQRKISKVGKRRQSGQRCPKRGT